MKYKLDIFIHRIREFFVLTFLLFNRVLRASLITAFLRNPIFHENRIAEQLIHK